MAPCISKGEVSILQSRISIYAIILKAYLKIFFLSAGQAHMGQLCQGVDHKLLPQLPITSISFLIVTPQSVLNCTNGSTLPVRSTHQGLVQPMSVTPPSIAVTIHIEPKVQHGQNKHQSNTYQNYIYKLDLSNTEHSI